MSDARGYALSVVANSLAGAERDVDALLADLAAIFDPDEIRIDIKTSPDGRHFRLAWEASGSSVTCEPGDEATGSTEHLKVDLDVDHVATARVDLKRRDGRQWTASESDKLHCSRPLLRRAIAQLLHLRRVAEENRLLLEACDRSGTAIFLFGQNQQIEWVNNRADELLTRQTEQLVAVSLTRDHTVNLMHFLLELLAEGKSESDWSGKPLLLTDGSRFELSIGPISRRGQGGHLVVLQGRPRFESERARPGLERAGLSTREIEVIELLLHGLRNAEIADRLSISEYTVKDHLKRVFHKLQIKNRSELVSHVLQLSG